VNPSTRPIVAKAIGDPTGQAERSAAGRHRRPDRHRGRSRRRHLAASAATPSQRPDPLQRPPAHDPDRRRQRVARIRIRGRRSPATGT
jgi:hypothetical protein